MNIDIKEKKRKKKRKKTVALLMLTGLTSIVLVMGTYAWFIGLSSVSTSSFDISVSTANSLYLSLDGSNWSDELSISEASIMGTATGTGAVNAYTGHTNHWTGTGGLVPISTSGVVNSTTGRLNLYSKKSITATGGGYRIMTSLIDNSSSEQDGYVAFDLFIKNGNDSYYNATYNADDDEAIYLTKTSSVTATPTGENNPPDYGLANSVRVAFVQIGRVASVGSSASDITSIGCGTTATNTKLCEVVTPTIWEPNDTDHDSDLCDYFAEVCKKKTVTPGTGDNPDTVSYSGACTAITDGTAVSTYTANDEILSTDHVDVYDGLNNFTVPNNYKLKLSNTFTDTMKDATGSNREAFLYLAANSITKVRVYIYLEGQDVDNYDLVSNGEKITIQFGFTKDQLDQSTNNS